MFRIAVLILLVLFMTACHGESLTDTTEETEPAEVPQTLAREDIAPPAEETGEAPPAIPAETAPQTAALPETAGEAIQPEPSFAGHTIAMEDFGDMLFDGEGYYFDYENAAAAETPYSITLNLPESWDMGVSTASDIPRREAGIYADKRMEYYSFLYRTSETDSENMEYTEKTTPAGQPYRYWETTGGGEVPGYSVVWHHCEYAAEYAGENYWFHIYFLTFSDDPEGYFADFVQPVIDSVTITANEGDAS